MGAGDRGRVRRPSADSACPRLHLASTAAAPAATLPALAFDQSQLLRLARAAPLHARTQGCPPAATRPPPGFHAPNPTQGSSRCRRRRCPARPPRWSPATYQHWSGCCGRCTALAAPSGSSATSCWAALAFSSATPGPSSPPGPWPSRTASRGRWRRSLPRQPRCAGVRVSELVGECARGRACVRSCVACTAIPGAVHRGGLRRRCGSSHAAPCSRPHLCS